MLNTINITKLALLLCITGTLFASRAALGGSQNFNNRPYSLTQVMHNLITKPPGGNLGISYLTSQAQRSCNLDELMQIIDNPDANQKVVLAALKNSIVDHDALMQMAQWSWKNPDDILAELILSRDADQEVLLAVVGNQFTSNNMLRKIMVNDKADAEVLKEIARQRRTNTQILSEIANDDLADEGVLILVVSNNNCTEDIFINIINKPVPAEVSSGHYNALLRAIANKTTKLETFIAVSNSPMINNETQTAIMQRLPGKELRSLERLCHLIENKGVLLYLAKNPETSLKTLKHILKSGIYNNDILQAIAQHHSASSELLGDIEHNTVCDAMILQAIAKNPNTSLGILQALTLNPKCDDKTLKYVAQHQNVSFGLIAGIIKKGFIDEDMIERVLELGERREIDEYLKLDNHRKEHFLELLKKPNLSQKVLSEIIWSNYFYVEVIKLILQRKDCTASGLDLHHIINKGERLSPDILDLIARHPSVTNNNLHNMLHNHKIKSDTLLFIVDDFVMRHKIIEPIEIGGFSLNSISSSLISSIIWHPNANEEIFAKLAQYSYISCVALAKIASKTASLQTLKYIIASPNISAHSSYNPVWLAIALNPAATGELLTTVATKLGYSSDFLFSLRPRLRGIELPQIKKLAQAIEAQLLSIDNTERPYHLTVAQTLALDDLQLSLVILAHQKLAQDNNDTLEHGHFALAQISQLSFMQQRIFRSILDKELFSVDGIDRLGRFTFAQILQLNDTQSRCLLSILEQNRFDLHVDGIDRPGYFTFAQILQLTEAHNRILADSLMGIETNILTVEDFIIAGLNEQQMLEQRVRDMERERQQSTNNLNQNTDRESTMQTHVHAETAKGLQILNEKYNNGQKSAIDLAAIKKYFILLEEQEIKNSFTQVLVLKSEALSPDEGNFGNIPEHTIVVQARSGVLKAWWYWYHGYETKLTLCSGTLALRKAPETLKQQLKTGNKLVITNEKEIAYLVAAYNIPKANHIATAKRCFERLRKNSDYCDILPLKYSDILVLIWRAIHDQKNLISQNSEDALWAFTQGLCEIQRAHAPDEGRFDVVDAKLTQESDNVACIYGTKNKLIEKLLGIHAFFELPQVSELKIKATEAFYKQTKNKLYEYLSKEITQITQSADCDALLINNRVIEQCKQIIANEAENIFQTYGDSVYNQNKQDPKFAQLFDQNNFNGLLELVYDLSDLEELLQQKKTSLMKLEAGKK